MIQFKTGGMPTTREGIGCIAFSPLAQGLLTDRYLAGIPKRRMGAARFPGVLAVLPPPALPEASDGVLADGVVRGQDHEPAHERLRHEQAIEGVAMKIRELRDVEG